MTTKAPRIQNQRRALSRWENEGGAPRSGDRSTPRPKRSRQGRRGARSKPESALFYFNITTESVYIEDPEGITLSDLQAVREKALVSARDLMGEGDLKGEDRRGWRFEITDRGGQHVLTVPFSEAVQAK